MRIVGIALAVLCMGLAIAAPAAGDGCYKCNILTECCEEAATGSFGKDTCQHNVLFFNGTDTCHDCVASGASCAGTTEPECDSPLGICEMQRSLLVPNGETIEPRLLLHPPVLEPGSVTTIGTGRCGAA